MKHRPGNCGWWQYAPGRRSHGSPSARRGSQFTSAEFTGALADRNVRISMDGQGRALDNVFIERLWRTVKYEDVYPRAYRDGHALHKGLGQYFAFYNEERRHTGIGGRTPAACYRDG